MTPFLRTNSPSKKRKVDNDTTDSASSGSEEGSNSKLSKIDSEQPIGQALIDMFKCNLCSQIPENIEKIKTCFMCPNKECSKIIISMKLFHFKGVDSLLVPDSRGSHIILLVKYFTPMCASS